LRHSVDLRFLSAVGTIDGSLLIYLLYVIYWYLFHTYRSTIYTPWDIKNVALYICPYFRQLLTDFQNSFIGTLCRQFAIMRLLYIPPHLNASLHYIVKYRCKAKANDNNINLSKWKKHFRPTLQ